MASNGAGMHEEAAPLAETATVAVAIRVRPLSASEHRSGAQVAWKHDEQKIWQTVSAPGGRAYTQATPYDFDRVYGAQTTTEQIHAESVSRSVARTLQGYHATILAYGQTSSGKTTTIRGGAGSDGLIPLSVRQVLKAVSTAQRADADAGGAARLAARRDPRVRGRPAGRLLPVVVLRRRASLLRARAGKRISSTQTGKRPLKIDFSLCFYLLFFRRK